MYTICFNSHANKVTEIEKLKLTREERVTWTKGRRHRNAEADCSRDKVARRRRKAEMRQS